MTCQIDNRSNMDIGELSPLIDDLVASIQNTMKMKSTPAITLHDDPQNAKDLLGKTAHYDPGNQVVTIYVTNRHPKDIMRSLAHELIHHVQNERGEFDNLKAVGEQGYAQKDPHLRNMEKEAYLQGNMCFRDWEDGYKNHVMESIHRQNSFKRRNNTMKIHKWKNEELNRLLMEKFGFGEGKPADDEWSKKQEVVAEEEAVTEENTETETEETVTEGEYNRGKAPDWWHHVDGGDSHLTKHNEKEEEEEEEEEKEETNESFRRNIRSMIEEILDSDTEAALNDPAIGASAELGILRRQKKELEDTAQGIGQDPNHPLNDVYYAIVQAIKELEG